MNVIAQPIAGYSDHVAIAWYYCVLRPGVGKADVYLWNHSGKQITLPKWTAVEKLKLQMQFQLYWCWSQQKMILLPQSKSKWKGCPGTLYLELRGPKGGVGPHNDYTSIFAMHDIDPGECPL